VTDPLTALSASPATSGLFLDFDGTLSEIVEVPSDARPVEGVGELLRGLALTYRLVAAVSGRTAAELREWLAPDIEIWGLYGAERVRDGRIELSDRAKPFAELMARVRSEAQRRVDSLAVRGVIVEDKGAIVTLHWRAAADPQAAEEAIRQVVSELSSRYEVTPAEGKASCELRPPVEFSKGHVVLDRARALRLRAALFAGDDHGDLPGFDALDELEAEGMTTVRVGVRSDEAPPELLDRADVVVEGPAGVVNLLSALTG
jgi:trehalose 6-phosphate phosphatase